MSSSRLQTFIGIGLLIIAVLAFLFNLLTQLPKDTQVQQRSQALPTIPRDMFSSENEITEAIRKLNTPTNVPVVVDPSNLGRSNAFENF